jgi:hypothetical protein
VQRGRTLEVTTPHAKDISSVVLVRNTAMTHLVDSDQRTVELPIVERRKASVVVDVTDNSAVLPEGPYTLFANVTYPKGETPSVGRQVFVGQVPARLADDIARNNRATVGKELAARAAGAKAAAERADSNAAARGGSGEVVVPTAAAPGARPVEAVGLPTRLRAGSAAWSSPLPPVVLGAGALVSTALLSTGLVARRRRTSG